MIYTSKDIAEQKILDEVPYNWKKHIIFQLPEIVYDICKLLFFVLIAYCFLIGFTATVIMSSTSPENRTQEKTEAVIKSLTDETI